MNWYLLTPELLLAGCVLLVMAIDMCPGAWKRHVIGLVAFTGLLIAGACLWTQRDIIDFAANGMYVFDDFAVVMKCLFLGITAVVIILTHEFMAQHDMLRGEFHLLVLMACIGMLFLASVNDFLLLFVSLELMTFSFYIMTAYVRSDRRSVEAGLNSIATPFMQ